MENLSTEEIARIVELSAADVFRIAGALMARRIRDAIDLGCKWLTTDTAEDTAEAPNPSYRNMVRAGFELAYLRPDYVCEPEAARR